MALFTKTDSTTSGAIPPPPAPITPEAAQLIAPAPGSTIAPLPSRSSPVVMGQVSNELQSYFQQLRVRIHQKLVQRLDVQNLRTLPADVVRNEVRGLIRELCQSEKGLINGSDQERLM